MEPADTVKEKLEQEVERTHALLTYAGFDDETQLGGQTYPLSLSERVQVLIHSYYAEQKKVENLRGLLGDTHENTEAKLKAGETIVGCFEWDDYYGFIAHAVDTQMILPCALNEALATITGKDLSQAEGYQKRLKDIGD